MPENKKEETTNTVRRFKLVGTTHQAGKGEDRKTYKTGDIVESVDDLTVTVPNKFVELVDKKLTTNPVQKVNNTDDLPPVDEEDEEEECDLEDMTVSELRKYASDNRIELRGATSKADIIRVIEAHK